MTRRRRTSIEGQWVAHRIDMVRSPAWRALSLSARRLLDRLEIEHAAHGGAENGKLPVTYDDFVRYGIHRHAIGPAIREAVALGFLKIRQSGRAGNADFRRPNSFELTYLSTQIGPTDDWAKIAEADAESSPSPHGRRRPKKQKTSAGKRQVSVTETVTENNKSIVRKPSLQGIVRKPALLSISRGGSSTPGNSHSLIVRSRSAPPKAP